MQGAEVICTLDVETHAEHWFAASSLLVLGYERVIHGACSLGLEIPPDAAELASILRASRRGDRTPQENYPSKAP